MKKLVLCLLIIISLVPVFPVYSEENTYSYDNSAAEFLEQLEITHNIDITDLSRFVTRAEFTAMVMRMYNRDFNEKFSGEFYDVDANNPYASEIYAAKELGFVNGTSVKNFLPQDSIDINAAVKILVSFLGYTDYALVSGGYPLGFYKVAHGLDILNGVDASIGFVCVGDAINMIFKALRCPLNEVVSIKGNDIYRVPSQYKNPLTEYFSYSMADGIIQTAGYYSSIRGYNTDKKQIIVSGVNFDTEIASCEDYLGLSAECWYDKKTNKVMAIYAKSENNVIKISQDDVIAYSDFKLTYSENQYKDKTLNLSRGFNFILNGRALSPVEDDFKFESGYLTLVDNNSDGKYDVVKAQKNEYFVVSSKNPYYNTLYDRNLKSNNELNLSNEDSTHYEAYFIDNNGNLNKSDYDNIQIGDVLMINRSADGKVLKIVWGDLFVKGRIEEISENNVIIGGNEYKLNSYFKNKFAYSTNLEARFLLAADGTITAISDVKSNKKNYGYFLDYAKYNAGLVEHGLIKILTHEGRIKIFQLEEKVKIDGVNSDNPVEDIEALLMRNNIPEYQLIKYSLSDNGRFAALDTADTLDDSAPTLAEKYNFKSEDEDSFVKYLDKGKIYYRDTDIAAPYFSFAGTLVFRVPKALLTQTTPEKYHDECFTVSGTSHLINSSQPTVDAYDYNSKFEAGAVVMYDGSGESGKINVYSPSAGTSSHLVEAVNDGIDSNGVSTKVIHTYSNGKFASYAIDEDVLSSLWSLIPNPGDIVRFSLNADGDINGIARDVIYSSDTKTLSVNYGQKNLSNSTMSSLTYVSGIVFSNSDTSLTLISDNYPVTLEHQSKIDNLSTHLYTSNPKVVIYNTSNGFIEHGSKDKINSVLNCGESGASYVCARMNYFSVNLVVIYK